MNNPLSNKQKLIFTITGVVALVLVLAFLIPPVREEIGYRWSEIKSRVYFLINPPEKSVFVPEETSIATATIPPSTPTSAPTQAVTPTAGPTETVTATSVPLPASALLDKVPYIDQHYGSNNCAPANLAMDLTFWGWTGKREDISKVVKPFDEDKNVMPYELEDYVNENTNLKAIVRMGGTVDLLKKLIAQGFPVMIEKGVFFLDTSGRVSWMGHYNMVIGYDDAKQEFITHDSYIRPDGKFKHFSYEELKHDWRAFDYTFLVVYPDDKWDSLAQVLGPYSDEAQSYSIAQSIANDEIGTTSGNDHFFALFNRGTNLVKQQDYAGAAAIYDQAYQFYTSLAEKTRPYRMTWYQTGPYYAYYYTARYQDLINMATITIKSTPEPYLEESFYWRALAESMLGQSQDAAKDICTSLTYHPNFVPSLAAAKNMGVTTCK